MKAVSFIPCYIDQFYPQIVIPALGLLKWLNCEVVSPLNQTCCGLPMARCNKNLKENFSDVDYIVSPLANCVLRIMEHLPHENESGTLHIPNHNHELRVLMY